MTNVMAVVGERRDNPDLLLLLGDDGHYYEYRLPDGAATPTEPTDDWLIDSMDAFEFELND